MHAISGLVTFFYMWFSGLVPPGLICHLHPLWTPKGQNMGGISWGAIPHGCQGIYPLPIILDHYGVFFCCRVSNHPPKFLSPNFLPKIMQIVTILVKFSSKISFRRLRPICYKVAKGYILGGQIKPEGGNPFCMRFSGLVMLFACVLRAI